MDRQNSDAATSQDTLISLQQLEPSPIASTSEVNLVLEDPEPPKERSRIPTFSLGLSGGSHGAAYYLVRAQKYSTYAFSIFAGLHVVNTSLIPLLTRSVDSADSYLLLTRPLYQSPALEPLLVAVPLLIHIGSGFALRQLRARAAAERYGAASPSLSRSRTFSKKDKSHASASWIYPPLSVTAKTGYALVPLVAAHVYVNRLIPLIHEGGSSSVGLGFVAHGFARHPFLSWATYTALIGVAVGHMAWGWARWMGLLPTLKPGHEKEAKRRWWTINGVVAAVSALWAAGGLGIIGRGGAADGWVGKGYDALYAQVPLLDL